MTEMKTKIFVSVLAALAVVSCTGRKESAGSTGDDAAGAQAAVADARLEGRWLIEHIVFSDSVSVRPAEEVPGVEQYIAFDDSTYFIHTNCNTISGLYTLTGDSIVLGDGAMTEMACDNMATEDALRRILPYIVKLDIENDSIARLNGSQPSEYIVLRKMADDR